MRTKYAAWVMLGILGCFLFGEPAQAGKKKQPDFSKLPPASDRKDLTYDKDIRPIFEASCFKCHGPEKHKGKLRLDNLPDAVKGSEDGKVILPGDGTHSPLVINIAHAGDEDDFMPPPKKGQPLTPEQIGLVRAWIDQGAK